MYDVCIVGAGIIGCAIARELTKFKLKIVLVEKNDDVGAATTKANSGIVHGGYADKPGTIKAKLCVRGNYLYDRLNQDLHFGFKRTGSFVIGFNEQDQKKIEELMQQGIANGLRDLQIVDGKFVLDLEPRLNQDIKVALYCPSAGVVSSYEFAIALAENAIHNGAELKLNSQVKAIKKSNGHFEINTEQETISAKVVINAAGLYSDQVARMVGIDNIEIKPRSGQYLLFDKDEGTGLNRVIFQVPDEISKGILVTTTYHGNLLIGPDATTVDDKDNLDTTADNISKIIASAKKSLPEFDLRKVITTFSGNRAAAARHDFIIEESKVGGFINVAAIESPGLTAAPAIAGEIIAILKGTNLLSFEVNDRFDPKRKPYLSIADMSSEQLTELIKKDPDYGLVVCRCEMVSRGEIRDALHREIPIKSLDAIKRRTRAGMGRCQGGFCAPKIMEIIHEELKIPKTKITKKGRNSLMIASAEER